MIEKTINKIKTRNASHLLAVLFLVFSIYVGIAGLPQFFTNTLYAYWEKSTFDTYVDVIDEQYHSMLSTDREYAFLQNKGTYINLNGLMAKLMGQPMMNDRLTLKNGHLASVRFWQYPDEEIRAAADNIRTFFQKQKEKGGSFLFVMCPSQIAKYEDLLPVGYTDTTNETADRLLALLEDAGVPYLDLRESMREEGMMVTDTYFVTDHHWYPQTGFWAYTKILEKLARLEIISPVDSFFTDICNYDFVTYEDSFLGSSGKRTGIYYAGVDDSIFIHPKFETDISITIEERMLNLRGRFEDICYNTDVTPDYSNPDYFYDNMYGLYGWGDSQVTQWRNENAPETGKFMLIGESFGNIPFSLMSIYLSSCDEVDMRYFAKDFQAYYEEYDPDTVILEVNVDQAVAEITLYPYFPH